jgi:hypothetical protein
MPNSNGSIESTEKLTDNISSATNIAVAAVAVENLASGPGLWNFFNALAFVIFLLAIFISIFYGLSMITNVIEVKNNWAKYRCDPSIMPFASFYGFNTAENFNYCVGNIFSVSSAPLAGSFSSILSKFTGIISVFMGAINSIRTTVATLGGGINVIFQEFTDRISSFFFKVRLSAIRIKFLMQRIYATMFSVIYMGLSGITGATNFSNTILFGFLDTFCFVPETLIEVDGKGKIPIMDVQIGDILLPTKSRVTAKFHFGANGQTMVRLNDIIVSSNHYLVYDHKWIRADKHPDAILLGPFTGNSLLCLNTDDNQIPIGKYIFRDYDETSLNNTDFQTMKFIESRINGTSITKNNIYYPFNEYFPSIERNAKVKLEDGSFLEIDKIEIGDKLSNGGKVVGKVQREITEYTKLSNGIHVASSTLVWNKRINKWERAGKMNTLHMANINSGKPVFISLFVTPSSIIELTDNMFIRDSMELCSPDSEMYYAQQLNQLKT